MKKDKPTGTRRGSGHLSSWEFVDAHQARAPTSHSSFLPEGAPSVSDTDLGYDIVTGPVAADVQFQAESENIRRRRRRCSDVPDEFGRKGYVPTSVSGNTDSTAVAADNHGPAYPAAGPDGVTYPLTVQALGLRDRELLSHYVPGNVQAWAQEGTFPSHVQPSFDQNDSMVPDYSSGPSTVSSWDYVAPQSQSSASATDEYVAGAGALFDNHSTLYLLYGSMIPDYLVKGS